MQGSLQRLHETLMIGYYRLGFVLHPTRNDLDLLERADSSAHPWPRANELCLSFVFTQATSYTRRYPFIVDWDYPLLSPKERDLVHRWRARMYTDCSRRRLLFYRLWDSTIIPSPMAFIAVIEIL